MSKKGKDGNLVEGIFIPIDKNELKRSTKEGYDNVYLDIVAFPLNQPQKNEAGNLTQTHLVKQSLDKERREQMTEEERNNQPIIGNLIDFEKHGGGQREEQPNDAGSGQVYDADNEDDDLPF
ncbi:MAG: hypothetical protein K9J21_07110 [Bacteroidales bacterium]|nr:hypothetical protein [Bacteroidales bacterium]